MHDPTMANPCPSCGHDNDASARYCEACAQALAPATPSGEPAADPDSGSGRRLQAALLATVVVLALIVVGLVVVLARGDDDEGATTTSVASSAPTTTPTTAAPTTTVTTPTTAAATDTEDGRFPGNVTRTYVAPDGTPHLEIDYVLFYSGADAQAQAAARGTDAPNDIFIVNDNPRLRDFPIAEGTVVRVVCFESEPDCPSPPGSTVPGGLLARTLSVDDWIAQGGAGGPGDLFGRASDLFYVTIEGGQVVAIDEQYVP